MKYDFIGNCPVHLKTADLPLHTAKFLYVKKTEKRSVETLKAYESTLGQFETWLRRNKRRVITPDNIRDYIHYLAYEKIRWDDHPTSPNGKVGLSSRSVNNLTRNMKVFFNHLVRERVIQESPLDNVNYQKEPQNTFALFTDEDVIQLMDAPNRKTYTGFRDRCLMIVLIDTGCRFGELSELKVSDIDFRLFQITFRAETTKTKTTRIVPITPATAKELKRLGDYIDAEPDDYLWMTQYGERYYADSFAKMLKIYAKRAGVTGARVSPHTFRHYFAVNFLLQGGEPIALMRILGHTTLSMTEKYVRYTADELQNHHEKASPVTKLYAMGIGKPRRKVRFK